MERRGLAADLSTLLLRDNATDAEGSKQVLGTIGVIIDGSVESIGGILTNESLDQGLSSGMVGDEFGNVVHKSIDNDERGALEATTLDVVLGEERKRLNGRTPVESLELVLKTLFSHLEATLFDFIVGEALKIEGKAEDREEPDGPLGRIVSVPVNSVAEIIGELVVEVVVSLAEGEERNPGGVARSVDIREG